MLIYKLTSFGVFNYSEHCGDTCDFPITYPIIWLVVGCGIFILMLMLVSGINSVGEKAREALSMLKTVTISKLAMVFLHDNDGLTI